MHGTNHPTPTVHKRDEEESAGSLGGIETNDRRLSSLETKVSKAEMI